MGGLRRVARVDANQSAIVGALRAAGAWIVDLSGVGKGCPDLLVCGPAQRVWVLLEIKDGDKAPSRRKLTAAQVGFHRDCPAPLFVVTNIDEALAAVGVRL